MSKRKKGFRGTNRGYGNWRPVSSERTGTSGEGFCREAVLSNDKLLGVTLGVSNKRDVGVEYSGSEVP